MLMPRKTNCQCIGALILFYINVNVILTTTKTTSVDAKSLPHNTFRQSRDVRTPKQRYQPNGQAPVQNVPELPKVLLSRTSKAQPQESRTITPQASTTTTYMNNIEYDLRLRQLMEDLVLNSGIENQHHAVQTLLPMDLKDGYQQRLQGTTEAAPATAMTATASATTATRPKFTTNNKITTNNIKANYQHHQDNKDFVSSPSLVAEMLFNDRRNTTDTDTASTSASPSAPTSLSSASLKDSLLDYVLLEYMTKTKQNLTRILETNKIPLTNATLTALASAQRIRQQLEFLQRNAEKFKKFQQVEERTKNAPASATKWDVLQANYDAEQKAVEAQFKEATRNVEHDKNSKNGMDQHVQAIMTNEIVKEMWNNLNIEKQTAAVDIKNNSQNLIKEMMIQNLNMAKHKESLAFPGNITKGNITLKRDENKNITQVFGNSVLKKISENLLVTTTEELQSKIKPTDFETDSATTKAVRDSVSANLENILQIKNDDHQTNSFEGTSLESIKLQLEDATEKQYHTELDKESKVDVEKQMEIPNTLDNIDEDMVNIVIGNLKTLSNSNELAGPIEMKSAIEQRTPSLPSLSNTSDSGKYPKYNDTSGTPVNKSNTSTLDNNHSTELGWKNAVNINTIIHTVDDDGTHGIEVNTSLTNKEPQMNLILHNNNQEQEQVKENESHEQIKDPTNVSEVPQMVAEAEMSSTSNDTEEDMVASLIDNLRTLVYNKNLENTTAADTDQMQNFTPLPILSSIEENKVINEDILANLGKENINTTTNISSKNISTNSMDSRESQFIEMETTTKLSLPNNRTTSTLSENPKYVDMASSVKSTNTKEVYLNENIGISSAKESAQSAMTNVERNATLSRDESQLDANDFLSEIPTDSTVIKTSTEVLLETTPTVYPSEDISQPDIVYPTEVLPEGPASTSKPIYDSAANARLDLTKAILRDVQQLTSNLANYSVMYPSEEKISTISSKTNSIGILQSNEEDIFNNTLRNSSSAEISQYSKEFVQLNNKTTTQSHTVTLSEKTTERALHLQNMALTKTIMQEMDIPSRATEFAGKERLSLELTTTGPESSTTTNADWTTSELQAPETDWTILPNIEFPTTSFHNSEQITTKIPSIHTLRTDFTDPEGITTELLIEQLSVEGIETTELSNIGTTSTKLPDKAFHNSEQITTKIPSIHTLRTDFTDPEGITTELLNEQLSVDGIETTELSNIGTASTKLPDKLWKTEEFPNTERRISLGNMTTEDLSNAKWTTTELPNTEWTSTELPNAESTTTDLPSEENKTIESLTKDIFTTELPNTDMTNTKLPDKLWKSSLGKVTTEKLSNAEWTTTELSNTEWMSTDIRNTEWTTNDLTTEESTTTESLTTTEWTTEESLNKGGTATTELPIKKLQNLAGITTEPPTEEIITTELYNNAEWLSKEYSMAITDLPTNESKSSVINAEFHTTQMSHTQKTIAGIAELLIKQTTEGISSEAGTTTEFPKTEMPLKEMAEFQIKDSTTTELPATEDIGASSTELPTKKKAEEVSYAQQMSAHLSTKKLVNLKTTTESPNEESTINDLPIGERTSTKLYNNTTWTTKGYPTNEWITTDLPLELNNNSHLTTDEYLTAMRTTTELPPTVERTTTGLQTIENVTINFPMYENAVTEEVINNAADTIKYTTEFDTTEQPVTLRTESPTNEWTNLPNTESTTQWPASERIEFTDIEWTTMVPIKESSEVPDTERTTQSPTKENAESPDIERATQLSIKESFVLPDIEWTKQLPKEERSQLTNSELTSQLATTDRTKLPYTDLTTQLPSGGMAILPNTDWAPQLPTDERTELTETEQIFQLATTERTELPDLDWTTQLPTREMAELPNIERTTQMPIEERGELSETDEVYQFATTGRTELLDSDLETQLPTRGMTELPNTEWTTEMHIEERTELPKTEEVYQFATTERTELSDSDWATQLPTIGMTELPNTERITPMPSEERKKLSDTDWTTLPEIERTTQLATQYWETQLPDKARITSELSTTVMLRGKLNLRNEVWPKIANGMLKTELTTTEPLNTEWETTEMPNLEWTITEFPNAERKTTQFPTIEETTTVRTSANFLIKDTTKTEFANNDLPNVEPEATEGITTELPTIEWATTELPLMERKKATLPGTDWSTTELTITKYPVADTSNTELINIGTINESENITEKHTTVGAIESEFILSNSERNTSQYQSASYVKISNLSESNGVLNPTEPIVKISYFNKTTMPIAQTLTSRHNNFLNTLEKEALTYTQSGSIPAKDENSANKEDNDYKLEGPFNNTNKSENLTVESKLAIHSHQLMDLPSNDSFVLKADNLVTVSDEDIRSDPVTEIVWMTQSTSIHINAPGTQQGREEDEAITSNVSSYNKTKNSQNVEADMVKLRADDFAIDDPHRNEQDEEGDVPFTDVSGNEENINRVVQQILQPSSSQVLRTPAKYKEKVSSDHSNDSFAMMLRNAIKLEQLPADNEVIEETGLAEDVDAYIEPTTEIVWMIKSNSFHAPSTASSSYTSSTTIDDLSLSSLTQPLTNAAKLELIKPQDTPVSLDELITIIGNSMQETSGPNKMSQQEQNGPTKCQDNNDGGDDNKKPPQEQLQGKLHEATTTTMVNCSTTQTMQLTTLPSTTGTAAAIRRPTIKLDATQDEGEKPIMAMTEPIENQEGGIEKWSTFKNNHLNNDSLTKTDNDDEAAQMEQITKKNANDDDADAADDFDAHAAASADDDAEVDEEEVEGSWDNGGDHDSYDGEEDGDVDNVKDFRNVENVDGDADEGSINDKDIRLQMKVKHDLTNGISTNGTPNRLDVKGQPYDGEDIHDKHRYNQTSYNGQSTNNEFKISTSSSSSVSTKGSETETMTGVHVQVGPLPGRIQETSTIETKLADISKHKAQSNMTIEETEVMAEKHPELHLQLTATHDPQQQMVNSGKTVATTFKQKDYTHKGNGEEEEETTRITPATLVKNTLTAIGENNKKVVGITNSNWEQEQEFEAMQQALNDHFLRANVEALDTLAQEVEQLSTLTDTFLNTQSFPDILPYHLDVTETSNIRRTSSRRRRRRRKHQQNKKQHIHRTSDRHHAKEEITPTNWWHSLPYAEITKFLNSIFDRATNTAAAALANGGDDFTLRRSLQSDDKFTKSLGERKSK